MKIFDLIGDLLFVPKCGACRTRMTHRDIGLCDKCLSVYLDSKEEYCDFCGMQICICRCIPDNMRSYGCTEYRKLIFYKSDGEYNPMRSMIYTVKRRNNIALMRFMANELWKLDATLSHDTIVSFPPRLKQNYKEYGYDHAEYLAKCFAKLSGINFKKLFRRRDGIRGKEQKLVNFRQRAVNIRGAFALYNESLVKGKNIILIDDVVTSGSTIGECADILYRAGAENVVCRSIAYTYRKNKLKKD